MSGNPLAAEYFYDRVYMDPTCGCWIWLLSISTDGYASCNVKGDYKGHRSAYRFFRGPIEEGHDLHHVCANRACINPWHLEPLPHAEHIKIYNDRYERFRQKPFCKQGHPRTPDNIHTVVVSTTGKVYRQCILCRRDQSTKTTEKRRQRSAQRKADTNAFFARVRAGR